MNGVHWGDAHSRFVQDRFPELGGGPVYIRTTNEVVINTSYAGARGFTGPSLDLDIRDELASRGEWRGRGFCCIIGEPEEFFRESWPEQLGLVLHELTHHLAERPAVLDEDQVGIPGGPVIDWSRYHDQNGEWLDSAIRVGHGLEFARSGLHVFWRCRRDVPLYSMNIFWERYGSPDVAEALAALDVELRTGGSILDILRSPAPPAFAKLWT